MNSVSQQRFPSSSTICCTKRADLAGVGLGPAADGDPLPVPQLALELHVDLEDGGADLPPHHLGQAVPIARDQVPARLLEDLQVPRVVDVPEGVEVLLADDELVLVRGTEHGILPAELSARQSPR